MLTAVTGINWGDEGKGRVIDLLAEHADVVVRYQGGNNAGHKSSAVRHSASQCGMRTGGWNGH